MKKVIADLSTFFDFSLKEPWFFTEYSFLLCLALFLMGYNFFTAKSSWKLLYLIAFSLFFYYKSSGPFLLLFVLIICCDYLIALWLNRLDGNKRKTLLVLAIFYSLSFLLYFKYSNFIITNLNALFLTKFETKSLFLPIGISFYTFQSLSYLIDVYRKEIDPSKKILDYGFYMTFFPHLVAGPIVRAKDFLPQIQNPLEIDQHLVKESLTRICIGLVKKLLIADFLGKYVDIIHEVPKGFSGLENLLAMYAYSFQIYFDFSGYSDIAIGISLMLGYRLKENFFNPYTSENITVFWRRWHISLSLWLRDYIYIPLGGNRRGVMNKYLFLLITMLIGGIWHGADWKFLFWGLGHGLLLVLHKLLFKSKEKSRQWTGVLKVIITFHLVSFFWIFFRASSFATAFDSIHQIALETDFSDLIGFYTVRPEVILLLFLSSLLIFSPWNRKEIIFNRVLLIPLYLWPIIFLISLQLILQLRERSIEPFIYFQF
jgi:D-alanyl-lipoteichoic acid acyltransferase DltB (MBOAT superfamily)